MYKILLSLFLLLISFNVKADDCRGDRPLYDEDGSLMIYICKTFVRNSSDLVYKTFTYDIVEADKNEINNVTGINMVQSGTEGQITSIFTRGTNSNHTLITLNGIAIKDNSTVNGAEDLGQHSFLGVDRVEVIKGPMGSHYGPNAIGGVINLITQANGDNYIELSHGSDNTNTQIIKLGKHVDNFIIDLRIENETSDGISVLDGNEDDGYSDRNYIFQVEKYLDNKWVLKSNIIQTKNKSDLDKTNGDYTDYTAEWNFNNKYISLQSKDSEISFQRTEHDREYNDKGTKDTYNSITETFLTSHTFHLDKKTDFTLGFEHELQEVDFDTNIAGYDSNVDKERHNHGYYFNIDKQFDSGVLCHTGLRLDTPDTFDDQVTGRVGCSNNGVRLSYSEGYKAPTAYEMYGKDNYGFLGNSNLDVETSKSYELGYSWKQNDIVFFYTEIDDMITYSYPTYENDSGIAKSKGIEYNWRQNYGLDWVVENNFTYNISKDGSGKEQLRRPEYLNTLSAHYKNYYMDWNYYGKHMDIDSSTYARVEMDDVSTIDVGFNMYDKNDILFYGSVNNIFDVNYERPDGYNQKGINFKIGFKKQF